MMEGGAGPARSRSHAAARPRQRASQSFHALYKSVPLLNSMSLDSHLISLFRGTQCLIPIVMGSSKDLILTSCPVYATIAPRDASRRS